jgi:sugar/nucleoside kinase (ribokinase family)
MADLTHWDVVVVGGANTDYLVRGQHLPRPGETIDGDTFQTAIGGKGVNQAVAASRMGARVAIVARVGNDARGIRLSMDWIVKVSDLFYFMHRPRTHRCRSRHGQRQRRKTNSYRTRREP